MSLEDIFALPSTARVTTFFLSLASTNPPLSEQGRSFGFFPFDRLSTTSGKPSAGSVVIPLKSSYRSSLSSPLPGGRPQPLQVLFSRPSAAGLFIPSPCWRAEKSIKITPLVNFFRYVFSNEPFIKFVTLHDNLNIMNVLGFCHTPQKRRHFFEHSITPHFPSSSKTTSFTAQQGKKGEGVFFLTTICFSSPMSPAKRGGFLYAVTISSTKRK